MPDEDRRVPTHARTSDATGERLARVETQIEGLKEDTRTRIEGVKEDTRAMRSAIHGVNGELQKIATAEHEHASSLREISKQTQKLPEIASTVRDFVELK